MEVSNEHSRCHQRLRAHRPSVFRILCDHPSIEVVCINDIFKNEALAYLLKYDTIMGTLKQDVTHDDHALYVGGKKILMTSVRNPAEAKWKELGIDVVIESTGIFTARADLEKHLAAGAKRVLLTVPPKDNVDQMVVMGVNDDQLKPEHRLGVERLVHHELPRAFGQGARRFFRNQARHHDHGARLYQRPATGGRAPRRLPAQPCRGGKHHPDHHRRRSGGGWCCPSSWASSTASPRVPVSDGSVVDLVVELEKHPDKEAINEAVRRAAEGPLKNVLEYSEVPLVSSDIIGNPHSSIFDSLVTQSKGDGYARVVSWYDNEWGYSNRCVNVIERLGQFG